MDIDPFFYCRKCKGIRNHEILHRETEEGDFERESIQWIEEYLIVSCLGCNNKSFIHIYGDSEMYEFDEEAGREHYFETTIFPYYLNLGSELSSVFYLPSKIQEIYQETINALKAKAYILSAAGFRAIIEAVCNNLQIKKATLGERIDLLFNKGHLTKKQSSRLHSIRFLGNDAIHDISTPKAEQIAVTLEIINHLLDNLYIHDKKLESSIETIINDFDAFIHLIRGKCTKERIGKSFTINELLGKSVRRINKKDLLDYEKKLISLVNDAEVDYLAIDDVTDRKFIVKNETPESVFPWD